MTYELQSAINPTPEDSKRTLYLLAELDARGGKITLSQLSKLLLQPLVKAENGVAQPNPLYLKMTHDKAMQPLVDAGQVTRRQIVGAGGHYSLTDIGRQALGALRAEYPQEAPRASRAAEKPRHAPKQKPKAPAAPEGLYSEVKDKDFRRGLGPYAQKLFDKQRSGLGANDNDIEDDLDDKERTR